MSTFAVRGSCAGRYCKGRNHPSPQANFISTPLAASSSRRSAWIVLLLLISFAMCLRTLQQVCCPRSAQQVHPT